MKHIILLSLVLFATLPQAGAAVTDSTGSTKGTARSKKAPHQDTLQQPQDSIDTQVFYLDMGVPHRRSFRSAIATRKLEAHTRMPIAFALKNPNPFKYRYLINATPISLFDDKANPFDSLTFQKTPAATLSGSNIKTTLEESRVNAPETKTEAINVIKNSGATTAESNKVAAEVKKAFKDASTIEETKKKVDAISDAKLSTEAKAALEQVKAIVSNDSVKIKENNTIRESIQKIDDVIKQDTFIKKIIDTPQNNTNATVIKDLKNDVDTKAPIDTQLLKIWNKVIASVDVYICRLQDLQMEMGTYTQYLKTEDFFDKDAFTRKRNHFRYRIYNAVNGYNKIINEFDGNPMADIAGRLDILKTKIAKFATEKAAADKALGIYYSVKLNSYMLPVDINGKNIDLLEITLQRLDYETSAPVDKYKYDVWIKGGIKIDISGGVFITSLMDNEYVTEDSATQKRIIRKDKGSYALGFGSMVNMTWRTGAAWVKPGVGMGLIFTSAESFQILTGASFVFGKEQRLVLHGGLSMGNVNELSSPYSEGHVYDLGTSNVPVTKKFKFGHYFGISYNITRTKVSKPASEE